MPFFKKTKTFSVKWYQVDLFKDPYCVCTIGHEKQRTKTHQGGGKKPFWSDTLRFQSNDNLMKVTLYDDDFGKDDLIG